METKENKDWEGRIIEAAKEEFIQKGYVSATMSSVAQKAGISRTALHYYYRTKDILFDAVFGQLMSSFLPDIHRVLNEEGTFLQKLPAIIHSYMNVIRLNPQMPTFVITELNRDRQHLFRAIQKEPQHFQAILRLRQQIEIGMQQGTLRSIPLVDFVSTIVSLVVFPMLIRQPLTHIFMESDQKAFEHFLDRREKIVVDIATRLLTPESPQV